MRMDKPKCNKTRTGNPSDCPPVRRHSNFDFFSVPFDVSKKFHRTYGQLNAGVSDAKAGANDAKMKEKYAIYRSERKSFVAASMRCFTNVSKPPCFQSLF